VFPQNNDTFRPPKNRYEEATLFDDGNQIDLKVQTSEGAKSYAEVRDINRTTQLASDLAVSSAEVHENEYAPTIEYARWAGSNLVAFRKHVTDSQLNIFDEAA